MPQQTGDRWYVRTRMREYGPFEKKRHAENQVRQLKKYHYNNSAELIREVK